MFLLSNSRKPDRPGRYAKRLDIPYLGHAGKPGTAGFEQAMARMGRTAGQTAMVGDQIFTDILGARRMGILALLVEPIQLAGNPGRYLRYAVEQMCIRDRGTSKCQWRGKKPRIKLLACPEVAEIRRFIL